MAPEDTSSPRLAMSSEDFADCRLVSLSGSIDHTNSDDFIDKLGALAGDVTSGGGMVVNLTALDFITSAGLRGLLLAEGKVKDGGGRMVVCGLKGVVQEVFRISMFESLLTVAEGPNEAVGMISDAAAGAYKG